MTSTSSCLARDSSGDLSEFKKALAKFNLAPLSPDVGVVSVRWLTFGYRMPSRATTVKIVNGVAHVSVVEQTMHGDVDDASAVHMRKKANVKLARDPLVLKSLGLKAKEDFWRPLTEHEDLLASSCMDGGVWWFEFSEGETHKFVYMPNAEILLKHAMSEVPEVRGYYTMVNYYTVIDFMRELLIQSGFVGWVDEP